MRIQHARKLSFFAMYIDRSPANFYSSFAFSLLRHYQMPECFCVNVARGWPQKCFLFPLLTFAYNNIKWKKSCIMLIITIRNNKASWTSQSNTHKLTGVLFLILDYGSCFLCLLATLLVITFPIFSAFFTYACMYGSITSIAGAC